ncbi:hypothetical protein BT63DRAFT_410115 [Microthyrium microscopicum]|uniref:Uncharacterized protein n=1 Tax=Microthyrium microscopicum TaxID=703497 RepID=A0A6A6ULE5_9PEZI|nr:hypothetical protein BT63DRAFT_410115 [Microthyrium microscopicum]
MSNSGHSANTNGAPITPPVTPGKTRQTVVIRQIQDSNGRLLPYHERKELLGECAVDADNINANDQAEPINLAGRGFLFKSVVKGVKFIKGNKYAQKALDTTVARQIKTVTDKVQATALAIKNLGPDPVHWLDVDNSILGSNHQGSDEFEVIDTETVDQKVPAPDDEWEVVDKPAPDPLEGISIWDPRHPYYEENNPYWTPEEEFAFYDAKIKLPGNI